MVRPTICVRGESTYLRYLGVFYNFTWAMSIAHKTVGGGVFYISCTLDTCVDVIRQCLL